ncbi:MAG: hypothetical protein K0M46_03790 [Thiobacillus sp.]|nr:hypothetical protein [Thiobacillus sp.]
MLNQLSTTEKLAAAASACVLAALALIASLKLKLAPSYSDFIVGNITWQAATKLQDLIAGPVFIFILFFGVLFFLHLIIKLKNQFGGGYSAKLSSQLIWWTIPFFSAIFGLMIGAVIDEKIFAISALGIMFIAIASVYNAKTNTELNPELFGLGILSVILISILPLEIALVLGRAPIKLIGDINLSRYVKTTYVILGFGVISGLYYAVRYPDKLSRHLAKLILVGQVGLPTLFITLYPARLLQPTGELTKYETTVWLKILIIGMVLWGLYDVINRYRKYSTTTDWTKLLSPVAIFALLVGLKVGNTVAPGISPDDYHFGESLLGWWSYLQGTIPYLEYVPAHGLIDDDLNRLMSSVFYDGSAGSIADVGRLSFAILAFIAFISIYYFSGSLGLAFVTIFFLGGRLAWFFLTPFLCLWFSQSLRESPSKWLIAWMVSVPIIILGVPPQGLLLVAASGVMAAYFAWLQFRSHEKRSWAGLGISLTFLTFLGLVTPLGPMFFGAIRYVLENGPINQVAYGVPWEISWNIGTRTGFVFEAIRMSWVVIPIVCLTIIYLSRIDFNNAKSSLYPAIVVLLFTLLLIPYSMGRIDPVGISRPGVAAIFGWTILLPIVVWTIVKPKNRAPLILVVACMGALLNSGNISFSNFVSAISSKINTPPLRDGRNAGFPNIGKAYVQEDHWDRLVRLNALLSAKLSPGETYLDLTSRNAQYFYLNRRPVMAVTAPYNMVPLSQQKRAVEQLSKSLPTLALLEGGNIIHDGGGLALRNPLLYRFVVDNYIPRYEDGFVVGHKKNHGFSGVESTIEAVIKDITDENWDRGFNRTDAAIVLSDPELFSFINVGDQLRIRGDKLRRITRVSREGSAVWFEGAPIVPSVTSQIYTVHVIVSPAIVNEYRASLFQRSFSISDFQKIPVAWGRSEKSLKNKMTLVNGLDGISPSYHQIIPEARVNRVNGDDPQFSVEIASLALSGRDAGLLKFDFTCYGKSGEPRIQVYWWGDDREGPFEPSSVRFTADNGILIVPLDTSPFWLTLKKIKGIRIDLDNASACKAFSLENMGLFQRVF